MKFDQIIRKLLSAKLRIIIFLLRCNFRNLHFESVHLSSLSLWLSFALIFSSVFQSLFQRILSETIDSTTVAMVVFVHILLKAMDLVSHLDEVWCVLLIGGVAMPTSCWLALKEEAWRATLICR